MGNDRMISRWPVRGGPAVVDGIVELDEVPFLVPEDLGEVRVLIIAWKTDDRAQIVGSLQRLKEKEANSFEAGTTRRDFINGFDDAIDRAKELRHDFGFRTLDSGFAPEIVCVKNYRRVTP